MTDETKCELIQTLLRRFKYRVDVDGKWVEAGPFDSQSLAEDHIRSAHPNVRGWTVTLLSRPR